VHAQVRREAIIRIRTIGTSESRPPGDASKGLHTKSPSKIEVDLQRGSDRKLMHTKLEDFDIGQDTRTPVALIAYRYDCPFKFTGKINKLTFDLGPAQYTEEDRKQPRAIADRVARAKD
jgi:hypothetical protein